MAKVKETVFVCTNCGNEFNKWMGQCSFCKEWNSLKEVKASMGGGGKKGVSSRARTLAAGERNVINLAKLSENKERNSEIISTTIGEFDRVLGKGIVRGSVVLFSGEPGIGKSTLLTQLLGKVGGLYVAGEESPEQIGLRVKRLGLDANKIDVLATNSIEEVAEVLERVNNVFNLVVVDSIQVMMTENIASGAGSPGQIRESTFRLVEMAKKLGVAIFVVGHVTKEGDIAGPKLLEHMVDTVLYFEGERSGDLRILRTTKNRFGPTDEVGVFRMEEGGLNEVRSEDVNLVSSGQNSVGAAVTVVLSGNRPMMVEVQALVVESFAPMPKRIFSGVDYNRGQLLVAVAQKVLGIPLYKFDVFIAVSGGIRLDDTGADLAIVAAMWSSYKEKALGGGNGISPVLVGEVSLLGEIKRVRGWEKREKEAKSLGRKLVDIKNVGDLRNFK